MNEKPTTMMIDDVLYVRKDSIIQNATPKDNMPFVLVRSDRAGVFFGYLKSKTPAGDKCNVELVDCRRVWYWSGAASISQLATDGTSKPNDCKFPPAVSEQEIFGVIEILPITETAAKILKGVKEWRQ